jgi:osmotically-inducible protein OsmY
MKGKPWDPEEWDREHWERWMDTVRSNQRNPGENYGSVGGDPYQGGVFSSATYGSGAEFYSVTGMYENPLLERRKSHRESDVRIHDEIREVLTRHPLVDPRLMDVHVENGVVTLSGEVSDRRMKYLAGEILNEVSGVKEIHNKLRVLRNRAA